ncbi:hypothetical protein FD755_025579, partial [Muntiacus reevesi]
TDAVISYHRVTAVAGQSVTLPCYYNGEVTSMCWGRGACAWLDCGTNIIWTDGYRVTYRRDGRYQLNGHIGGRDVSLTINNAALSDSGLYCCRIEVRGWFNDIKTTLELRVNPAYIVSSPSSQVKNQPAMWETWLRSLITKSCTQLCDFHFHSHHITKWLSGKFMFFYVDVDILIFLTTCILPLKFLMKTELNTQSLYKLGLFFNLNEIDISTS